MLKSYLLTAIRNFKKYKTITAINIAGLAVGIAGCILVLAFVWSELTVDAFHRQADTIYRIYIRQDNQRGTSSSAITPAALAPVLKDEMSGIRNTTRIQYATSNTRWLSYNDKSFQVPVSFAESTLFEIFSFELAKGDPRHALSNKGLVLSQEMAEKLFGDKEPLGEQVTIAKLGDFTVTGVLKKIPANSSLRFDVLININQLPQQHLAEWYIFSVQTYILLPGNQQPEELQAQLAPLVAKYFPPRMLEQRAPSLHLQPLKNIYFNRENIDRVPAASMERLYILSAIALLIALIACFNFMNLTIAGSAGRAREVGVRKTAGARRVQLFGQFMAESLLLCLGATMLGFALAQLFLPTFCSLIGQDVERNFLNQPVFLLPLLGLVLFFGILSGIYPALALSRFRPVEILRKKALFGDSGLLFRRLAIITQFSLSTILIICTFTMRSQHDFLLTKNLGFNAEQVIAMPIPDGNEQIETISLPSIKAELLKLPGVTQVSAASSYPGCWGFDQGNTAVGSSGEEKIDVIYMVVDADFIPTLGIDLTAGSNFSSEPTSDMLSSAIVNETFVGKTGITNPIGNEIETVYSKSPVASIIGVVQDFHFKSLLYEIEPTILLLAPQERYSYLLARLKRENLQQTLAGLEALWEKFSPGQPFEYQFLDDIFARQYDIEKRWSRTVLYSAWIAIFIACIGLFGLAGLILLKRSKEIGIRKVLGASDQHIVTLIAGEFAVLVLPATLVAWPAGYAILSRWLHHFPYRINLTLWPFLWAGVLALVIALLTVSWQVIHAARANPVEALRYE